MEIRVARHTAQLEPLVRFYRDGLGLVELGAFADHDAYSGVFLGFPGTALHLEFTTGGSHPAPAPHPESLLVLYLGDHVAVAAAVKRCAAPVVEPANPYWAREGVTLLDPDGFRVVLVAGSWPAAEE